MCYPLLGILVTLILYFYMKTLFKKIINTAEDQINEAYNDIEYNRNDGNTAADPKYLVNTMKNYNNFVEPSSKFHE
jgi:hypothetical protein